MDGDPLCRSPFLGFSPRRRRAQARRAHSVDWRATANMRSCFSGENGLPGEGSSFSFSAFSCFSRKAYKREIDFSPEFGRDLGNTRVVRKVIAALPWSAPLPR